MNINDMCECGHIRSDHVYEEGACRPGYVCRDMCEEFTESGITRQEVRTMIEEALKDHVKPAPQPDTSAQRVLVLQGNVKVLQEQLEFATLGAAALNKKYNNMRLHGAALVALLQREGYVLTEVMIEMFSSRWINK